MNIFSTYGYTIGLSPTIAFLLQYGGKANDSIIQITNEVVPVFIIIYETSSIDIKLVDCLETPINFLKVL